MNNLLEMRTHCFEQAKEMDSDDKILKNNESWNSLNAVKNNQVFAVNANSFFSKPSIRTVEGIEILAKIIQPEEFTDLEVSNKSFTNIDKKSP